MLRILQNRVLPTPQLHSDHTTPQVPQWAAPRRFQSEGQRALNVLEMMPPNTCVSLSAVPRTPGDPAGRHAAPF